MFKHDEQRQVGGAAVEQGGRSSRMLDVGQLEWAPFAMPGTTFKLLNLDNSSGRATFLLRIPAGLKVDPHKHLGSVEAYVIQGSFSYSEEGSVHAGGYVWEPGGAVHQPIAEGDEDLVMFVVAHGPIQAVDPDGALGGVLDNDLFFELARAANQHAHL